MESAIRVWSPHQIGKVDLDRLGLHDPTKIRLDDADPNEPIKTGLDEQGPNEPIKTGGLPTPGPAGAKKS